MILFESNLVYENKNRSFGLTASDDFETEVELLRRSDKFLAFLDQRLKSTKTIPLDQVEAELLKE